MASSFLFLKIVVVEPSEKDQKKIESIFERIDSMVVDYIPITTYSQGLEQFFEDRADVFFISSEINSGSGSSLIEQARIHGVEKPIIFLTQEHDFDTDIEAVEAGADDYLVKSDLNPELLEKSILYSLERWKGIEQRNRLQKEREAREFAEEESDRKDTFLKMVSHELKSPITSILSSVYLLEYILKRSALEEEEAIDLTDKIKRQVNNMTFLIEDLLDLSKVESGKLSFNPKIFSVSNLIKEVVEDIQTSVDHIIELNTEADLYIEADRQRIRQVITNLINNAVKYSPSSKRVIVSGEPDEFGIKVSVTDFGIGIKKEEKKHIFSKFYSGKQEFSDEKKGGLGLGLYLTKKIISLHKGKIDFESLPGEKTKFFFSLPLKQSSH